MTRQTATLPTKYIICNVYKNFKLSYVKDINLITTHTTWTYTYTNHRGKDGSRRLRGSLGGVMGEEGSVEDTGDEVLRLFEWQGKRVVALAKARTLEEDRGNMDQSTW